MRGLAGILLCAALAAISSAAAVDKKAKKTEPATLGLATPGIRIPFASLKPETDIPSPGKPSWVFFAESLYAPNPLKQEVDKIDAKTGKLGDPIKGIAKPCARMTSAFASLWAVDCTDGSVVRLDSKTLKQTARIPVGSDPSASGGVVSTADSIWVLADSKTTLVRIDPDDNMVAGEVRLQPGCKNLTFGESALWVVCPDEDKVLKIDPATNLVAKRIKVATTPEALAIGQSAVWVLCRKEGKVERIDPKTDKVIKTIELGSAGLPGEMAFGEGSVWVTMPGLPLTRINPETDKVVQQFHGAGGGAIGISPGAIWLSNLKEGTLWKIDPKRVAATLAE